MTYAAACAFGNIYFIFSHDQMYQSGTPCAVISFFHSSLSPLPLRTDSMMVNDSSLSKPIWIKYTIISSRVQMAEEIVAVPSSISFCALPSHTSVPCERPEIRTRSENSCGFASITICIAKSVPNSGMPSAPSWQPPISSGVIPRADVFLNSDITEGSSNGISLGSMPVKSSSRRIIVGSSCPRISSFNRLWSME